MNMSQVDVSSLMSRPIRILVELIGFPETFKLLKALGGTPIKIPKQAINAKNLLAILTFESVSKLCEEMGGQEFAVPKLDKIHQSLRNQSIRNMYAAKSSSRIKRASELALQFNLSRQQILNICQGLQGLDEESSQEDLFSHE